MRRIHRKSDLRHIVTRIVGQAAGLLNASKIGQGLGVSRDTTVSSRSVLSPKVHVVDSGFGAHVMRISSAKLRRLDPSSTTELGHLLESFLVHDVIRQTTWMSALVSAGHWRARDEDEVDLVLERHDGAVVGIDVKASERVEGKQLADLRKLRDRLGSAFVAGSRSISVPSGPKQKTAFIHFLSTVKVSTVR